LEHTPSLRHLPRELAICQTATVWPPQLEAVINPPKLILLMSDIPHLYYQMAQMQSAQ
jgi:hypothetical protein